MDSTRLSGIAPQFTVTSGFDFRSPEPWIALAISSLPTPLSPSIRIGMLEEAARFPRLITRSMAGGMGDDVVEGERAGGLLSDAGDLVFERGGLQEIADRDVQPFRRHRLDHEILRAGIHHVDHGVDAAVAGLHDHRRGDLVPRSRSARRAVEFRHDHVEDDQIDVGGFRPGHDPDGFGAVFGGLRSDTRIS
jgi:hypothetical protein